MHLSLLPLTYVSLAVDILINSFPVASLFTFVDAVSAGGLAKVAADVFLALRGVSKSLVCDDFGVFGFGVEVVLVG